MRAVTMQRRQNDNVDVEHLHQDEPAGEKTETMRILFEALHEQKCEGNKEPADHQQGAKGPPRLRVSQNEILRLLRDVGVPDEHVLAETDVGPENTEGEHPLSHDVVMLHC